MIVLKELFRYRALALNLVLKDLRLKYRDSVFGVLWSLLHPLLLLAVYTLAFKIVMRVPVENYPAFLLVGLLPWTFFATSLQGSTLSVIGAGGLMRKVRFPRETLPLATVLFAFVQLALALAAFLPAAVLLLRLRLSWTALLFVPILGVHFILTLGLALCLSALAVRFRDVIHLTEVALTLVFWLTPILYPVALAPKALVRLFSFSPPAAFTIAYQDVLYWGRAPDGRLWLAMITGAILALSVGVLVFRRRAAFFAEEV
ncbi:MAG: ABC transporter permease [Vicinamibacteria bacterium]|nr:ABC transporter permease [Vicinamibacteria bacterium]